MKKQCGYIESNKTREQNNTNAVNIGWDVYGIYCANLKEQTMDAVTSREFKHWYDQLQNGKINQEVLSNCITTLKTIMETLYSDFLQWKIYNEEQLKAMLTDFNEDNLSLSFFDCSWWVINDIKSKIYEQKEKIYTAHLEYEMSHMQQRIDTLEMILPYNTMSEIQNVKSIKQKLKTICEKMAKNPTFNYDDIILNFEINDEQRNTIYKKISDYEQKIKAFAKNNSEKQKTNEMWRATAAFIVLCMLAALIWGAMNHDKIEKFFDPSDKDTTIQTGNIPSQEIIEINE